MLIIGCDLHSRYQGRRGTWARQREAGAGRIDPHRPEWRNGNQMVAVSSSSAGQHRYSCDFSSRSICFLSN